MSSRKFSTLLPTLMWVVCALSAAIAPPAKAAGQAPGPGRVCTAMDNCIRPNNEKTVITAEKYGPWAVIAGGSEGLGASFARNLGSHGINLVLIARRPGPLEEL